MLNFKRKAQKKNKKKQEKCKTNKQKQKQILINPEKLIKGKPLVIAAQRK